MNYENLKKELKKSLKGNSYSSASDFEQCILLLRENDFSYSQIQSKLGNPSKKQIREVLLKYNPDLIEQSLQTKSNKSTTEKRVWGLICKSKMSTWDLDEFGETVFELNDTCLYFTDEWGYKSKFNSLDERTQLSILYNIAKILNINLC